jgi:hypothetical protein
LERHPTLRVLISEGGATWAPFVGDRLNEAYRQHSMFSDGRLPRLPKEYIMEQVYASFQHDETAVPSDYDGYPNVMLAGYPHIEGTYPHAEGHRTLDVVDDATSDRIRQRSRTIPVRSAGRQRHRLTSPPAPTDLGRRASLFNRRIWSSGSRGGRPDRRMRGRPVVICVP